MKPTALFEVSIGMVLIIGLSWWLRPADPLFLHAAYPWMALATTVFAARYGVLPGSLAVVLVALAWWLFYGKQGAPAPAAAVAGLAIQTLVVGHLCDGWLSRLHEVQEESNGLRQRLAAMTGDYYLIKVAKEQSEKERLLREALSLEERDGHIGAVLARGSLPGAQRVLEQLATTGAIAQAGLYACVDARPGTEPHAHVGAGFALDRQHPLIAESIERQVLTWVNESDFHRATYLACVPVATSDQQLLGLLVIRRMAFLALSRDNLELLLVLLSAYADGIGARRAETMHV